MDSPELWRRVRPLQIAIATALVVFAILVGVWPDWTLRYAHALAWPVVALIAVAVFGPALARRVPSLSALHLPGGVVATFDIEQHAFDLEDLGIEGLEEAVGEELALDEGEGGDEDESLARMATTALAVAGTIIGAFQIQLDFLMFLDRAPDGLTLAASRAWFVDALAARGLTDPGWNPDHLIGWLQNQGAIALTPDGIFELTLKGRGVLAILNSPDAFVAPKAV
jgi:hypothetical protein